MTKKSTPASTTACAYAWVFCGDSAPAAGTPASRIWATRFPISSGLIGSAYTVCIRLVASTGSCRPMISSSRGCGSSYRVHRPSRLSTPSPPS